MGDDIQIHIINCYDLKKHRIIMNTDRSFITNEQNRNLKDRFRVLNQLQPPESKLKT